MAFSMPHNYLVVHGTVEVGGLVDIWQFGLRLATSQAGSAGNTADALADVTADVAAWWGRERGRYTPTVKCLGVKYNRIGIDGKYMDDETFQGSIPGPSQPGTHTQYWPYPSQLAVAVTLHTAADRGRASKGRVFLPSPNVGIGGNDGTIQAENRTLIATNLATLIKDLNNSPGLDAAGDTGVVQVMSRVGAGSQRPVTGVSVGSRFDVQRRRANKIREVRIVQPIPG